MSNDSEKKLLTGYFKVWGTDACKNEDRCGGRITLFVANTECISCDPKSYTKESLKPTPCANCDRLEGEMRGTDEVLSEKYNEINRIQKQLEMCKEALDEIQHITIGGLKMDAADGIEPRDWKYYARECLKAIEKDGK